jgi:two-component system, OmpR family, sensor kinase
MSTPGAGMWQRIWHTSIKNRLTFLFFTITAGAIMVLYFYVVPQLESNLTSQRIDALEQDSANYSRPFETAIEREVTAAQLDSLTSSLSEQTGARVTLLDIPVDELDPENLGASPPYVVSDSSRADAKRQPSTDLVLRAFRSGRLETSTKGEGGHELAQAARPIFYRGQPSWVVVFSEPLDEVHDTVGLIQRQVLIAGLIALVLAVVTGYYAASVLARRVKRLERAVGEVAAGNFADPIPVDSADELGQLAQKFNEMQWRLERLDTARKVFIANASHELRTPIFSLGGFVELLQDEDLDERTRDEFLTTMREQVDRLQKLTTDLLDLSRLDAGSLDLELEPVPLRTLANQVAGEFAAAAARKDAELEVVDRDSEFDVEAICDPERVAQIVRVLIDNALVHTPDGTTVSLTVRARREAGSPPAAELLVTDDGPGIRRRELSHIFERFHTSDSAQGSGLGLAIARELARRMQGTLDVASRPGTTTFMLALPLAPERERPPRPRAREPLPA